MSRATVSKLASFRTTVSHIGRERLRFLSFITVAHFAIHWFMQLFPVILPTLKSSMRLNDVQVGSLTSTRMFVQAASNFPSGVLADSFLHWRGLIVTASLLFMGGAYGVFGTLSGYAWALVAVGILAVGTALFHPASVASLSNQFPERRATAIAVYGMGATLGNTITPLAVGFLLANFSWQKVLETQVFVGLAAACLVWIYASRAFATEAPRSEKAKPLQDIKGFIRNPVFLVVVLVRSFNQIARQVSITFLPIYLTEYLGYSGIGLGFYLTLMSISGLVAQPVMGVLSDRLGRKAVMVPALFALGLVYLLIQWARPGVELGLVIVAIGFLFYTVANVTTAAVLDVAGTGSQASSFGLLSLGTNLLVTPAPILAGFLIERFGIMAAFAFPGICLLVGACIVLPMRLGRG